jgi:hypothetical protein
MAVAFKNRRGRKGTDRRFLRIIASPSVRRELLET